MGLDMYAFSLEHSPAFTRPHDILNYRIPAEGKGLPAGRIVLGMDDEMYALMARALPPEAIALLGPPSAFSSSLDVGSQFLDSKFVLPGSTLIHRWRKHPNLHGWMERRWRGMPWHRGANKAFNYATRLPLDEQTLDALEHAVRQGQLPPTAGPQFGESWASEQESDLEFIAKAREALAAGKYVYYTSWW